jgi:hypothetical protein
MHQSYIFFFTDDGEMNTIPSSTYVSLVRGETSMARYSGKRVRVADMYVALDGGRPCRIENETYSFLYFDESGRADPHDGSNTIEENRAFYDAALNSPYSKVNCDPEVQKVREAAGKELSWLPTGEEHRRLRQSIFGASGVNQNDKEQDY